MGLAMLHPSPDSAAVLTAGAFVLNSMMALLVLGTKQWLTCCSSMAWITRINKRGRFGGSAEAAAGSGAVLGFIHLETQPGSPSCGHP